MAPLVLSCSQIQIKNSEWLGSKGPRGAVAFQTFTPGKKSFTFEEFVLQWNDLKHKNGPMVCTRTDVFVEIKTLWEKCVTNGACSFATDEQKNQADMFFKNIESVQKGK